MNASRLSQVSHWVVLTGVIAVLVFAGHRLLFPRDRMPDRVPAKEFRRAQAWLSSRSVIRVVVTYDWEFDRDRGGQGAEVLAEAFGLVNLEWHRYRAEWFEMVAAEIRPSGDELDASHVLGTFLLETTPAASTIHVRVVGRQLEVYTEGTASPIGGLAFRGSDVVLVSAPSSVTVELLAYYLFHEIGHLWEAYDIPFAGGETTYGEKSRYTFEVDAGNAEILESSSGPAARDTPNLAPEIIAQRLANARQITSDPVVLTRVNDLLLHEAMPSNPAWVRKKRELFDDVRDVRVRRFICDLETSPRERGQETEVRRKLARHYWRANEALLQGDAKTAEKQLEAMRVLHRVEANAHVGILLGAVERKIRKHTR